MSSLGINIGLYSHMRIWSTGVNTTMSQDGQRLRTFYQNIYYP